MARERLGAGIVSVIAAFAACSMAHAQSESGTTSASRYEGFADAGNRLPESAPMWTDRVPSLSLRWQTGDGAAAASDPGNDETPAEGDPWEFQITPYMFFPDVDGDATVQGLTAPLDLDFHDLVELLDKAFSFRFVAQKKSWGLFANLEYMDLYGSGRPLVNPLKIRADIEDFSVDLGIIYRLPPLPLGGYRPSSEFQPTLRFEPFGGLRYHYLKQHIVVTVGPIRPPRLGKSKDWLEPMVGAVLSLSLMEQLTLIIRGDASGFGICSASDLTWNVWGGADYAFTDHLSVKIGHRDVLVSITVEISYD